MPTANYHCSKCNKPFIPYRIAFVVLVMATFFCACIFIINVAAGLFEFYDQIEGTLIAREDVLIIGIMGTFLIPAIGLNALSAASKRHGGTSTTMVCPACKERAAADIAESQRLAEESAVRDAFDWSAEMADLMKGDAQVKRIVEEYKVSHGGLPTRETFQEIRKAMNLERAANYEGAATIFEKYQLWNEAGRVRKLDDQQVIKHITVDMNELIDQVSTKGLAIPYKCRSCGASITIDKNSSKEGLKFCSYCGTAYNIEDMSSIIQKALE